MGHRNRNPPFFFRALSALKWWQLRHDTYVFTAFKRLNYPLLYKIHPIIFCPLWWNFTSAIVVSLCVGWPTLSYQCLRHSVDIGTIRCGHAPRHKVQASTHKTVTTASRIRSEKHKWSLLFLRSQSRFLRCAQDYQELLFCNVDRPLSDQDGFRLTPLL